MIRSIIKHHILKRHILELLSKAQMPETRRIRSRQLPDSAVDASEAAKWPCDYAAAVKTGHGVKKWIHPTSKRQTIEQDATALLAMGSADVAAAPADKAADARAALVKEAEEAKEATAEKARAAKEAARKALEKAKSYGAAYGFDQFIPRKHNMTAKDSMRQYAKDDVPQVNDPKKPEEWARNFMDDHAKADEHYMERAVREEKAAAAAKKEAKEAAAKETVIINSTIIIKYYSSECYCYSFYD